jgi:hypothetical protein
MVHGNATDHNRVRYYGIFHHDASKSVLVFYWQLSRSFKFFFIFLHYLIFFFRQVRPAVKDILGLDGTFKDGPWSYRISSLVVMSPIYSVLLVLVGTVFGRHAYFRHFSVKMLSRFGIPPEMLDKTFHTTKKTFRKW